MYERMMLYMELWAVYNGVGEEIVVSASQKPRVAKWVCGSKLELYQIVPVVIGLKVAKPPTCTELSNVILSTLTWELSLKIKYLLIKLWQKLQSLMLIVQKYA